jgi:hypothetical protein
MDAPAAGNAAQARADGENHANAGSVIPGVLNVLGSPIWLIYAPTDRCSYARGISSSLDTGAPGRQNFGSYALVVSPRRAIHVRTPLDLAQ